MQKDQKDSIIRNLGCSPLVRLVSTRGMFDVFSGVLRKLQNITNFPLMRIHDAILGFAAAAWRPLLRPAGSPLERAAAVARNVLPRDFNIQVRAAASTPALRIARHANECAYPELLLSLRCG